MNNDQEQKNAVKLNKRTILLGMLTLLIFAAAIVFISPALRIKLCNKSRGQLCLGAEFVKINAGCPKDISGNCRVYN